MSCVQEESLVRSGFSGSFMMRGRERKVELGFVCKLQLEERERERE